jgi:drug/metabolite transporter (DMT)-like permease
MLIFGVAIVQRVKSTLNPIVAILLASLFLGETVTPVLIAGLVFVIGGIFVANRRAAAADAGGPRTPKA